MEVANFWTRNVTSSELFRNVPTPLLYQYPHHIFPTHTYVHDSCRMRVTKHHTTKKSKNFPQQKQGPSRKEKICEFRAELVAADLCPKGWDNGPAWTGKEQTALRAALRRAPTMTLRPHSRWRAATWVRRPPSATSRGRPSERRRAADEAVKAAASEKEKKKAERRAARDAAKKEQKKKPAKDSTVIKRGGEEKKQKY